MRLVLFMLLVLVSFPSEVKAYLASVEKISNKQFALKNRVKADVKCKLRLGHDTIFIILPIDEVSDPISILSNHNQKQLSVFCREVRNRTYKSSRIWRLNRYAYNNSYSSVFKY